MFSAVLVYIKAYGFLNNIVFEERRFIEKSFGSCTFIITSVAFRICNATQPRWEVKRNSMIYDLQTH